MTPSTLVIPLALSLLATSLPCTTVTDDKDSSLSVRGSGNQITLQSTTTWIEHSGASAPAVARPLPVAPESTVVCGLTGQMVAGASGERSVSRLCLPTRPT
ncbi:MULTISPECIES: hypothetical protein, partial [unclassified Actinomyces]|uniref:hypothetical protein n=1 Tax=unclassified Actinomyces TaxID=2609248 RepID=UPI00201702D5